jgi:hypothetical protein
MSKAHAPIAFSQQRTGGEQEEQEGDEGEEGDEDEDEEEEDEEAHTPRTRTDMNERAEKVGVGAIVCFLFPLV